MAGKSPSGLFAAALIAACVLLAPWSVVASTPAPSPGQQTEAESAPKVTDQNRGRLLPQSSSKPGRVVQFEFTEEYEQGLLPPGRRVELIVRLLEDHGKPPHANLVAILESPNSARTLISLIPGKDPSVLEATASLVLPPTIETGDPEASRKTGGISSTQMVRVNVTFARLRGMRLDPVFKRRVYLALGHNGFSSSAGLQSSLAAGEVQISTVAASTSPAQDDHPPRVPGIIDHVVIESDVAKGQPVSSELQDYWRELGRRIQHRWAERHQAVTQEKIARAPQVHFRLYPTGIVQMIYLEKSSGNSRVDIAGLESVLETQPFPPLPAHPAEPYVNVHVRFRGEPRD